MNGYEQQYYEIPGAQWRWRAAQLNAQGLPFEATYNRAAGVYIVVVQTPVGAQPFAYETHPSHRPGFRVPAFHWRGFVQILCVLAIVGAVGYIAYSRMAGGTQPTIAGVPVEVGGMKLDPTTGRMVEPSLLEQAQGALDGAFDWLGGLLPSGAQTHAAPQTDTGWTWPPKNPVGDAIDGTMQAVTWLTYAVIALGVLWLISFVVSIVGKFRR